MINTSPGRQAHRSPAAAPGTPAAPGTAAAGVGIPAVEVVLDKRPAAGRTASFLQKRWRRREQSPEKSAELTISFFFSL